MNMNCTYLETKCCDLMHRLFDEQQKPDITKHQIR